MHPYQKPNIFKATVTSKSIVIVPNQIKGDGQPKEIPSYRLEFRTDNNEDLIFVVEKDEFEAVDEGESGTLCYIHDEFGDAISSFDNKIMRIY